MSDKTAPPNSTEANNQARETSRGFIFGRKRRRAKQREAEIRVDPPGMNRSLTALLDSCKEAHNEYLRSSDRTEEDLCTTLARTFALYQYAEQSDDEEISVLFVDAGIRVTKSTQNPAIPFVKLVFGKATPRSTIGRYAAILRFAGSQGVEPDDLLSFIKQKGGIAECANEAADKKAGATKRVGREQQIHLQLLRDRAVVLSPETLAEKAPGDLFAALIAREKDGSLRLLSLREEKESAAKKFSIMDD